MLELIESGAVEAPARANGEAELAAQYFEYISWARDTETGLRFGFPGDSMWGAASAPDNLP